jgi:hypothetical protein
MIYYSERYTSATTAMLLCVCIIIIHLLLVGWKDSNQTMIDVGVHFIDSIDSFCNIPQVIARDIRTEVCAPSVSKYLSQPTYQDQVVFLLVDPETNCSVIIPWSGNISAQDR